MSQFAAAVNLHEWRNSRRVASTIGGANDFADVTAIAVGSRSGCQRAWARRQGH